MAKKMHLLMDEPGVTTHELQPRAMRGAAAHASRAVTRQPAIPAIPATDFTASAVAGIPSASLALHSARNTMLKRGMDVVFASLILAFLAPVMLIIALLIPWDGHRQVLFRQVRHGRDGREFDILKFRSMKPEIMLAGLPPVQATRKDARITRLGKFLRRTSLDELPQLFNVIKGDMSLVGPRPHAVAHNAYYRAQIEHYGERECMRPGMTGWAQVNGWRGQTDTLEKMRRRVAHDLHYIAHWSPWLDVKIILRTLLTLLHKNAY